jgi:hypothetical protein
MRVVHIIWEERRHVVGASARIFSQAGANEKNRLVSFVVLGDDVGLFFRE